MTGLPVLEAGAIDTGWIARIERNPAATSELLCFHHAGSSASTFKSFKKGLHTDIGLLVAQLPGRENRISDPFATSLAHVRDAIVEEILASVRRPLFLYGHSMGGTLAYEVASELDRREFSLLSGLIVSGSPSPQMCYEQGKPPHLAEDHIKKLVLSYGLTIDSESGEVELDEEYWTRIVADYRLVATNYPPSRRILSCPLQVHFGSRDSEGVRARIHEWLALSSGSSAVLYFEGGHFFIKSNREEVLRRICEFVERHAQ